MNGSGGGEEAWEMDLRSTKGDTPTMKKKTMPERKGSGREKNFSSKRGLHIILAGPEGKGLKKEDSNASEERVILSPGEGGVGEKKGERGRARKGNREHVTLYTEGRKRFLYKRKLPLHRKTQKKKRNAGSPMDKEYHDREPEKITVSRTVRKKTRSDKGRKNHFPRRVLLLILRRASPSPGRKGAKKRLQKV